MSDEIDVNAILEPAATRVRDPISGRSIWFSNMIHSPNLQDHTISFEMHYTGEYTSEMKASIERHLHNRIIELGWKGHITIVGKEQEGTNVEPKHAETSEGISTNKITEQKASPIRTPLPHNKDRPVQEDKDPVKGMSGSGMGPHGGPIKKLPIPGIKKIIAVASGKGGVGKSTVACNLAISLQKQGLQVGLMDADVYGPSLPIMMRVNGSPIANHERQIIPLEAYGIKCMSMGFMVEDTEPIIWRGPMVMGVIRQFFQNVAWGELDVLIVDLRPGTGDAQLTMIQAVNIDGAVIVTTPQQVAVMDAVRGIEMFVKLKVPILGIVENMAYLDTPDGMRLHPFGEGGGRSTAETYQVPYLGDIPLNEGIRLGGDIGMPAALSSDGMAIPFEHIATEVRTALFSKDI